jgi:hypothetical protein
MPWIPELFSVVRGGSAKLTAARIYDDVDPPLA